MEIVTCPKCGRPRPQGQPCPVCGDTTTPVIPQPKTPAVAKASPPTRTAATRPQRKAAGRSSRGLIAAVIVAAVLIAAVATVVAVLMAGGAAVVEEEAALVGTPDRGRDQAAQSLLRNAMTAMDAAFVESADYTSITQATLKAMEPAINWNAGRAGVCASPPTGATAQTNSVSWAGTGRLSYELGTWSESGVQFGVKVDKAGGGTTQYRGGAAADW